MMTDYVAKEVKLLNKIADRISILDGVLDKMEDTDSKVKHFMEQEKALHEIRAIIREENKIGKEE